MKDAGADRLPAIPQRGAARRPLSFVTVWYSGELEHNLAQSPCVKDPLNELIVVDNRGNLAWPTLSSALVHGIGQAKNDLVVLVHEDVLLLPGWQAQFEWALDRLEDADPEWYLLGAAGWDARGRILGHWKDPRGYRNLLAASPFVEVDWIDEHLMVVRRDRHALDPGLPSIHNIGRDLSRSGRASGRRTYVIDAPTVHKHADAEGRRIRGTKDSPKIRDRTSLTYLADKSLSDDYLGQKWGTKPGGAAESVADAADHPIVLASRGGGGSRLISQLARHAGIHLGNDLGPAGDTLAMVHPVYRAVLGKYRYPFHSASRAAAEIREAGLRIRDERPGAAWGFKLPESMLVLDEILAAFPRARLVHLVRDPMTSCLRRTHMTARTDNQIGQAVLRAAYRHLGIPELRALSDPDEIRMAVTTLFHFDVALPCLAGLPPDRQLTVRFEDILADPRTVLRRLIAWKERHGMLRRLLDRFGPAKDATAAAPLPAPDAERASQPMQQYSEQQKAAVAELLSALRHRLGYPGDPD